MATMMSIAVYYYKFYHARLASQGAIEILAQDLKLASYDATSLQRASGITLDNSAGYHVWETEQCFPNSLSDCTTPSFTCTFCAPGQSCFPSCSVTSKTVALDKLYPIAVKITQTPAGCPLPCTITFYPASTSTSATWSPVTVYPAGNIVLESGDVSHKVTIDANGIISVQ